MPLNESIKPATRTLRSLLALATVATLASACQDSSVAPSSQARTATVNRPVLDKLVGSTTLTYTPGDAIYANVGGQNVIYIPANAVCDPGSSGYGADSWDKSCNPATRTITITAKSWLDDKGHPYVEFHPALRFVPNKWVVLYVADNKAVLDGTARIIYCPDAGSCVDEAKTDPSLFTFHWAGGVYRRIKHFSGYNVAAGDEDAAFGW
jgi:hypothetical protein